MLTSRYRRIEFFFARVIASLVFWELILPRIGLHRLTKRTRSGRLREIASRFRALANELGGLLIKVGQFLSSRVDVLPEEITSELAALQDEVRAEKFEDIRPRVERELNGSLVSLFADFETAPLAAASLGQVHRARLREPSNDVQAIVVKVQRPNIEAIVATDLAALRTVAKWLNYYTPIRKRADVPALLNEFTRIVEGELDYLAEARNAEAFAENFRDQPEICVPRVVWTHTTRRVLALEDVFAIKITDYAAITAAGVDRAQVAQRVFHTYLKQIFDDGFFHADPHPGNLFVFPLDESVIARRSPELSEGVAKQSPPSNQEIASSHRSLLAMTSTDWRLTFVDFGMAGRVTPNVRAGLRELAIAIGTRDAPRMLKGYQMLGVLLPGADLQQLEKMEAKLFERFWGKTMGELRAMQFGEIQEFTREFRGVILSLPFQIPQDLILLGRTVAILSGICTGLDPNFNVWDGLAPFAEKLIAEELAVDWKYWLGEVATSSLALLTLPTRLRAVLGRIERGEIQVQTPSLTEQVIRLELALRRMTGGLIFAGLLFSGAQLYLAGEKVFAGVLFAGAVAVLVWMMGARK